jgi:Right handed beta helix region
MMRSLTLGFLLVLLPLAASAQVGLELYPPLTMDDAGRSVWRAVIRNDGPVALEDVPFSVWVSGTKVVGFPEGEGIRCERPYEHRGDCSIDLAAHSSREITYTVETYNTQRYGWFWGAIDSRGLVVQEVGVFAHPYLVTTVADDGPGSLRQAILDINRDCNGVDPCSVVFNIPGPVPDAGWFTIAPKSPLPAVTALHFFLDGASQTRHTGDTNRGGPELVLDGSSLSSGNGLEWRGGIARAADVRIERFPGNGIDSRGGQNLVQRCELVANGLRGLQVEGGAAEVRDNTFRANGRAGAWFNSASTLTVRGNLVVDNGASGLFFHRVVVPFSYSAALVEHNVIANNREAGIAMSRNAVGRFAPNVLIGNGGNAVDVLLDGPTIRTTRGIPGQGGVLGTPVITSARWTGTETIIEGHLGESVGETHVHTMVFVYASSSVDADGMAESEELLGALPPVSRGAERLFTLRVPRDLRGKWINASTYTMYVHTWDVPAPATSEVGAPLRVD